MLEQQVRERTARLEAALTELRSTQEQVVKQERLRALGMMAGGIAHDFNNALTMVLGYGELLLPWLRQQGVPRESAYLDHMIDAAKDAATVVSRLRDFYRPAENNEIRVPVDLNAVVERVVSLTSPKWKGKVPRGRRANRRARESQGHSLCAGQRLGIAGSADESHFQFRGRHANRRQRSRFRPTRLPKAWPYPSRIPAPA
jgi:C4-dicarboxylate-specific signal transduction histidine kinase